MSNQGSTNGFNKANATNLINPACPNPMGGSSPSGLTANCNSVPEHGEIDFKRFGVGNIENGYYLFGQSSNFARGSGVNDRGFNGIAPSVGADKSITKEMSMSIGMG